MTIDLNSGEDILNMGADNFSFADNLEVVPYLNNDSDSIQDKLEEVEKNTKSIQENLVSVDEKNVEFIDFSVKNKKNDCKNS